MCVYQALLKFDAHKSLLSTSSPKGETKNPFDTTGQQAWSYNGAGAVIYQCFYDQCLHRARQSLALSKRLWRE